MIYSDKVLYGWHTSGVCDRLTNLLLASVIARATERTVCWYWPLSPGCHCSFHELFTSTSIIVSESPRDYSGPRIGARTDTMYGWDILNTARDEDREQYLILDDRYYGHNYDGLSDVISPSDHINISLRRFINERWRASVFGIHARRTDRRCLHPPTSHQYFHAVDRLIDMVPDAGLFVASDEPECAQEFVERYGTRVIMYPVRTLRRNSPEGIIDAVITLYLLRETNGVIGCSFSGYSLCAGWEVGLVDLPAGRNPNVDWYGNSITLKEPVLPA